MNTNDNLLNVAIENRVSVHFLCGDLPYHGKLSPGKDDHYLSFEGWIAGTPTGVLSVPKANILDLRLDG